ncbi:P-loop NTPase [Micromonospora soli]|uniref:P-loop NTPase n=1 Tax=Micromonospora sp. NBRC 110009 TaxID=3061627 RepID=UPI002672C537|nr:P-loop NTPase [Micromonospora sp. NBRC 110009]WKT96957.1 P-loop NTPase [Micromonospora sp. NBRC 110009]
MDVPGFSRQSLAQLPIIAVASGKGGVGKSSVAVAIGRELARSGRRIGLVDADIAGPDVPRMLGLRRDVPAQSVTLARWTRGGQVGSGLEAMEVGGLKVASVGFLMAGNQGLPLGSDLGDLMLGRLIKETNWGDVEALVVDLPPGISFTQQGVLSGAGRVGTILVVTPAEVSHLDTGRALGTLREVRTPVLGGVENMAYFECLLRREDRAARAGTRRAHHLGQRCRTARAAPVPARRGDRRRGSRPRPRGGGDAHRSVTRS